MTNRRAPAARHEGSGAPSVVRNPGGEGAPGPVIVGGTFGLPPGPTEQAAPPPLAPGRQVLFVNARSALHTLLGWIGCPRVWVPSYLCEALLVPLASRAVDVRYYPVGAQLDIADDGWLEELGDGDAVVLIDYFGFPVAARWIDAARERGACVIEDAAMAFLSRTHGQADFTIYSPRKFIGVPDGGILVISAGTGLAPEPVTAEPPQAWWEQALDVAERRARFDAGDDDRAWFGLYREVEAAAPTGPFAMSRLSRAMLEERFDYAAIAARRAANFRVLLSLLDDLALFDSLPDGVVPLGFPVRLPDRDAVQQALFRHDVYPPVHWRLPAEVPTGFAGSHRLSRELLTLPCDQRYGSDEMERIARLVREALCR